MNIKKLSTLLLILGTIFTMIGCSSGEDTRTITDRADIEVNIPNEINRIIVTAPSNTEMLVGLGLGDKIIAVDNFSPTESLRDDIVTLDFKNTDGETMIGLEPDIIVASSHNATGASDPYQMLRDAGIPVVYVVSSQNIEDIYKDIEFLSLLFGVEDTGAKMVEDLQKEVNNIQDIVSNIEEKKTVYFEVSPSPSIFTTGNNTFQNDLIEKAGGINVFDDEESWFAPSEESILIKNPDVIITNADYLEDPITDIINRDGWNEIDAVKNGEVHLINVNESSRPSQNFIKALKEMAKSIYPEYFE